MKTHAHTPNPSSAGLLISLTMLVLTLWPVNAIANPTFSVVVGLSKPPYVLQATDSGFEIELVRNVLQTMGKSAKFVYVAFRRAPKMLGIDDIDAVMTMNPRTFSDASRLSDVYITYQNVAISLKRNQFDFSSISDLGAKSIASFQNANKVLGEEFAMAANKSPLFMEVADQQRQPALLMRKRVDVLVMDNNIFNYLIHQQGLAERANEFSFHYLFPSSPYRMAFKDKRNIALFNHMFNEYTKTEDYQNLIDKYPLFTP